MIEKIMDFLFYEHIEKFIFVGFIGLLVVLWLAVLDMQEHNAHRAELMKQCLNDGKKEYECEAMLKSNSNSSGGTTVVPMYMPR